MKKIVLLVIVCIFTSSHVFTQIISNLNLTPTQWKTDGNIVDETYFIGTKNLFPLKFKTNNIERLRITSEGRIGIGTLLPQAQLDVYGNVIFRNNLALANLQFASSISTKDIVVSHELGNLAKVNVGQLVEDLYALNCLSDENGNTINPTWANGTNKIYTAFNLVNVGIGTENPEFKLHVLGTTLSSIYQGGIYHCESAYMNNRMVIGSNDVYASNFGKLLIKNTNNGASLMIDQSGNNNDYSKIIYAEIHNPTTEIIKVQNTQLNYTPFLLSSSGAMEIHNGTWKTLQLDADGTLRSRKIIVNTYNNWPDYVFEKTYKLRPLSVVKTYIDLNGHLPEVPSAEIAQQEGIDLAEMNKILLKKIEEMTLYLIEQDARIKELEQKVKN